MTGPTSSGPELEFALATIRNGDCQSVGVVVRDHVIPLESLVARRSTPGARAPHSMRALLEDWDRWLDWLTGLRLEPDADEGWRPLADIRLGPPVPDPLNLLHVGINYLRPSRVLGWSEPKSKDERRIPFVFPGLPAALVGHLDEVHPEPGGRQFDFELELAVVIGRTATQVRADSWEDYVAGYTIANDFTMHFAWWSELRAAENLSDTLRYKNVSTYTPMGKAIVPRQLVPDPHNLRMRAWEDEELRADASTAGMLWSIGELLEYTTNVLTLRPGDLILTGSPLELPGPAGETFRGVTYGRTLRCQIDRLGTLENAVVERAGYALPGTP